jgi:glutamate dehydrogenase
LGGIPHDEYGMTSLSVRAYVHKIYETLKLENTRITKFQTGGPDGDLGSNEILLSSDNEIYIGLVDGSGVLVDTEGLDKDELKKLAHERKMINNYDRSKLSSKGFVITVDDVNFKIPETGEIIPNGVSFRNQFHLQIAKYLGSVDLFVPCGGRPAAIDIDNVSHLLPVGGKPIVKYIVEGANLFITQQAKLKLEKAGVVTFKDASANKGGVTSSSLEVLASLVLNDEEFLSEFNKGSKFYQEYVKEVQVKIVSNANKEADALLRLQKKTGLTLAESSDLLSNEINKLSDLIASSDELWSDEKLRVKILGRSIPSLLIKQTGSVEKFLERVPENYAKSLFATSLSTDFIYHGSLDFGNVIELLQYLRH